MGLRSLASHASCHGAFETCLDCILDEPTSQYQASCRPLQPFRDTSLCTCMHDASPHPAAAAASITSRGSVRASCAVGHCADLRIPDECVAIVQARHSEMRGRRVVLQSLPNHGGGMHTQDAIDAANGPTPAINVNRVIDG